MSNNKRSSLIRDILLMVGFFVVAFLIMRFPAFRNAFSSATRRLAILPTSGIVGLVFQVLIGLVVLYCGSSAILVLFHSIRLRNKLGVLYSTAWLLMCIGIVLSWVMQQPIIPILLMGVGFVGLLVISRRSKDTSRLLMSLNGELIRETLENIDASSLEIPDLNANEDKDLDQTHT